MMFSDLLAGHGTTPVALSQTALMIMLVVLALSIVGIGFGAFVKSKENFRMHRWLLSVAILMALGTILLVMVPSAYNYYVDPDVEIFSPLSIATIVHGVIGFPAVVAGLIYISGELPDKVKKWMRLTLFFWIVAMSTGVFVYLQMLGLL